jgi:hypothetical protein
VIYFIRATHDGPVKIGYVTDEYALDGRLSSLQVASPDELYVDAIIPGGRDLERDLHVRFAEGRIRGEWFRGDTPGLREFIFEAVQREPSLYMFEGAA